MNENLTLLDIYTGDRMNFFCFRQEQQLSKNNEIFKRFINRNKGTSPEIKRNALFHGALNWMRKSTFDLILNIM